MKTIAVYSAAFVAAAVFISLAWTLRESSFVNTLANHPDWSVSKKRVEMELMGADRYADGTQALAGNVLRLEPWHGYQEVVNRRSFDPAIISFRFHVDEGAWICFVFNRRRVFDYEPEIFHGLRFSCDPDKPSALLVVDHHGRFMERIPFGVDGVLRSRAWNTCELEWKGAMLNVNINGTPVADLECPSIGSQHIGFRGGSRAARVDSLRVVQRKGPRYVTRFTRFEGVQRLRFFRRVMRLSGYGLATLLLCFCVLLALFRDARTASALLLSLCATVLLTLWPWMIVEQRFFAAAYPVVDDAVVQVERDAVQQWTEAVKKDVANRHAPDVEGTLRNETIMLVGTSQAIGMGASLRAHTWANRLERRINHGRDHVKPFRLINAAVPGSSSPELLPLYEFLLPQYPHRLLLIALGCNDRDPALFRETLPRFLDLAREQGATPLLIAEAASVEEAPRGVAGLPVMEEIARAYDVPLFNLHDALRPHHDEGFV